MADIFARIRTIIGTTAQWVADDLLLGDGEIGIEKKGTEFLLKAGDGTKKWSALPYISDPNTPIFPTAAQGQFLSWDATGNLINIPNPVSSLPTFPIAAQGQFLTWDAGGNLINAVNPVSALANLDLDALAGADPALLFKIASILKWKIYVDNANDDLVFADTTGPVLRMTQGGLITTTKKLNVGGDTILINALETGAGVTSGATGMEFERGTLPNYVLIFAESDQSLRYGPSGASRRIATMGNTGIVNGVAYWDGNAFETRGTLIYDPASKTLSIISDGPANEDLLVLQNYDITDGNSQSMIFYGKKTDNAPIQSIITHTMLSHDPANANTKLDFKLYNNTSQVNVLTLLSNGNVGIGENNPGEKLVVKDGNIHLSYGTGTNGLWLVDSNNGIFSTVGGDVTVKSYNNIIYLSQSAGAGTGTNHIWKNNVSELMRLTSDGKLGIGTNAPDSMLDIRGVATLIDSLLEIAGFRDNVTAYNASPKAGIGFYGKYTAAGKFACFAGIQGEKENNADGDDAGALTFHTQPKVTGMTERMRITSDGNVGIGTGSVIHTNHVLHINENGNCYVVFSSSTGSAVNLTLTDGAAFTGGRVGYDPIADALTLGHHSYGNNISCMPSGDVFIKKRLGVGIGTTAPAEKLHLKDGTNKGAIIVGEAENPAPVEGTIQYNSTTKKFQGYDGTTWHDLH